MSEKYVRMKKIPAHSFVPGFSALYTTVIKAKLKNFKTKHLAVRVATNRMTGKIYLWLGLKNVAGSATYLGTINDAGNFNPSDAARLLPRHRKEDVWKELQGLNTNFLDYVSKIGKETGVCCICSRELTDEDSITAGIGPVCAKKFSQ